MSNKEVSRLNLSIMGDIFKDVRNTSEVSSASSIVVELGNDRKMFLFSGIVRSEIHTRDDDHVYRDSVHVNLGVTLANIESKVVSVGLASVNNDDSSWLFAVDSADVYLKPDTLELILQVGTGVSGDESYLHRFSYQVVVTAKTATTKISGKIFWDDRFLNIRNYTLDQINQLVQIAASTIVRVPAPAPNNFPSIFRSDTFVRGKVTGFDFVKRTELHIVDVVLEYEMFDLPYGKDIEVHVELTGAFLALETKYAVGQTAPPYQIVFTPTQTEVDNIDFRVVIPKLIK